MWEFHRWPSDDRMPEAIDEGGKHPGDAVHFCRELLVLGWLEIPEIVRQEQKVIELAGGSLGDRQEPCQFHIAIPTAPFGDVRRDRCGSPSQLARKPVPFFLRERARRPVDLQRQPVGAFPDPQVAIVPHLASRVKGYRLLAIDYQSISSGRKYATNPHSPKVSSEQRGMLSSDVVLNVVAYNVVLGLDKKGLRKRLSPSKPAARTITRAEIGPFPCGPGQAVVAGTSAIVGWDGLTALARMGRWR
jgi:hypothetical protein